MFKSIKRLFYIVLALAVAGIFFAPAQWKTSIVGEDNESAIVAWLMPETHMMVKQISARKALNGNWIVNGWIINRNDFVVEECKLRFYFGNGIEHRTVTKVLNPMGAGKPFRMEIPGHEGSEFKRFELYRCK